MGGVAIVLGSAAQSVSEYETAKALAPGAFAVCVNDALRLCPDPARAFATLHPEKARRFIDEREHARHPGLALFTFEPSRTRDDWRIVRERWGGSSGLYAVQIALEALEADCVICAGVPMDAAKGSTYAGARAQWGGGPDYVARYRRGWTQALPKIKARVRSLSGWTRELLGEPSREWIETALSATA